MNHHVKGFQSSDFDVFTIPGLEARMQALIGQVRPKLQAVGDSLAPELSARCGEPMYAHVAKHARRTINPPDDSWVAWSSSKRGYKALPHFQVGLWSTHLFAQFAVIYECPYKQAFAGKLLERIRDIRGLIPAHFVWSGNHMRPEAVRMSDLSDRDLEELFRRLAGVKQAELLCGIHLPRDSETAADGNRLLETVSEAFDVLLPLYRLAVRATS
jgi:uncharacterized protein YktB (UPF0637 family)